MRRTRSAPTSWPGLFERARDSGRLRPTRGDDLPAARGLRRDPPARPPCGPASCASATWLCCWPAWRRQAPAATRAATAGGELGWRWRPDGVTARSAEVRRVLRGPVREATRGTAGHALHRVADRTSRVSRASLPDTYGYLVRGTSEAADGPTCSIARYIAWVASSCESANPYSSVAVDSRQAFHHQRCRRSMNTTRVSHTRRDHGADIRRSRHRDRVQLAGPCLAGRLLLTIGVPRDRVSRPQLADHEPGHARCEHPPVSRPVERVRPCLVLGGEQDLHCPDVVRSGRSARRRRSSPG